AASAGAGQLEVTINRIGDRVGNTSLEEASRVICVVHMAMHAASRTIVVLLSSQVDGALGFLI
ncbi:2-isopropylmalate synthase A-like protein, partial [Tanacetum coccineum]